MALYSYRASNDEGRIIKGQLEALHETDLEAQLNRLELVLVSARAIPNRSASIKRLPRREVINFLFQFEMLIRAGVPILETLADLRDSADSIDGRNLAGGLYEKIEAGSTLGESFASYPGVFSEVIVSLIRSGEASGQLPEVLQEIVRSLKWQDEMSAQTKKLLMYPSFVFVVITGVVFFLMIYLVPQLLQFLKNMGKEPPLHTRVLMWVSDVFVNYWWAVLSIPPLIVTGLAIGARYSPGLRFKLHQAELAIPYIGPILKKIILARLADTFALMYRTGVPLLEGLHYCENVSGNLVIRAAVVRARERIASGTGISDAFAAEQLFPSLVIRMLRVGESTGAIDTALNNISYFYTRDIQESIGKVQAVIEPALTVVMGFILGWIMLAVLGPIYDTIATMKL